MNNPVYVPCFTHLAHLRLEGSRRAIAIRNTLTSIRQLGKLRRHVLSLIHPPMLPVKITRIDISNTVLTSPVFDHHDVVHLTILEYYIMLLINFVKVDFTMFKASSPPYYTAMWRQKLEMWADWTVIERWFKFSSSVDIGDNGWYGVALDRLWGRVHERIQRLTKGREPGEAKGKQLMDGLKKLWKLRHKMSHGSISTAQIPLGDEWENENTDIKWPGVDYA